MYIISLVHGGTGGEDIGTKNGTLAIGDGGARGTRVQDVTVVHVQGPAHEALRIRLTFRRAVVSGSYLTVAGHRAPGSVHERDVALRWDATVASPALKRWRRRVTARRNAHGRVGEKAFAVRAAAEELHTWHAPVNRWTLNAVLDLNGLRVTPFYARDLLHQAGWRRLKEYEYPHDAPGYGISNWVPGDK